MQARTLRTYALSLSLSLTSVHDSVLRLQVVQPLQDLEERKQKEGNCESKWKYQHNNIKPENRFAAHREGDFPKDVFREDLAAALYCLVDFVERAEGQLHVDPHLTLWKGVEKVIQFVVCY